MPLLSYENMLQLALEFLAVLGLRTTASDIVTRKGLMRCDLVRNLRYDVLFLSQELQSPAVDTVATL
jgi:hypothetical protein